MNLLLSLIWVFGIEFELIVFSMEFDMKFVWVLGIEFALLEIGSECGNFNNFVHNGFPYSIFICV